MRTLVQLQKFRRLISGFNLWCYRKIWKMDIDPSSHLSLSVKLDLTFPSGIHIGKETCLTFGTAVLTHDMARGLYLHTRIGRRCFIGARSLILPGVTIGDESIVAAGSVVTKNVPPRTIVAGNPARVIKENIEVVAYGRLKEADENERKCRESLNFNYFA